VVLSFYLLRGRNYRLFSSNTVESYYLASARILLARLTWVPISDTLLKFGHDEKVSWYHAFHDVQCSLILSCVYADEPSMSRLKNNDAGVTRFFCIRW
jgi:hypothetical protein